MITVITLGSLVILGIFLKNKYFKSWEEVKSLLWDVPGGIDD